MLLEELVCELIGYYIHCLVLYFSTHSLAKHIYFITETAISYYEMVDRALRCYDIQLETVILFNEFKTLCRTSLEMFLLFSAQYLSIPRLITRDG